MNSYWIWNYGDYEIFHSNRVNSRRQEFGADYPSFWKLYDVDRNVRFFRDVTLEKPGTMTLRVRGLGSLVVDGIRFPSDTPVAVEAGAHTLRIDVVNLTGLPAAYLESDVLPTDGAWYTLRSPHRQHVPAGFDRQYDRPDRNPEEFPFCYQSVAPVTRWEQDGGVMFDFGRELFGYLNLTGADPARELYVGYGESPEEALDRDEAIVRETVTGKSSYRLTQRAFRYLYIAGCPDIQVSADYEYLPLAYRGAFRCDREEVNRIWDVCAYTLHLTSREVLQEAIKRDRWLWGGDAYQAFKFNQYLFFDRDLTRRSLIALRGKEPFDEHINTITDYSLFWVLGVLEYEQAYHDPDFLRFIYPRAVSLMNFCAGRVNEEGFLIGVDDDWIFVDWSEMDKTGAVCAEQMLYIAANRAMAQLAALVGEDGSAYDAAGRRLTEQVNRYFWDEAQGAFVDSYVSGRRHVTRHANIFAVLYDIATPAQTASIRDRVLLNDAVTLITTPYFEGYELDVMGKLGRYDYIEGKLESYWKGMLDLGATTIWEAFDPRDQGTAHYAMYGHKYGKSLCHAWGASPIYLLGKYYLGVTPVTPGYETFLVRPCRGGFGSVCGAVPLPGGEVRVELSPERLKVTATKDGGTLEWQGTRYELKAGQTLELPGA